MAKTTQLSAEQVTQAANDFIGLMPVASETPMVLTGRRKIYSDFCAKSQSNELHSTNIITTGTLPHVINEAMKVHQVNAREIEYLLNYYKGDQPILYRDKEVRDDVNNTVVMNYAYSFTRAIIGYTFGNMVQYIDNETTDAIKEEIKTLNDTAIQAGKNRSDTIKSTNSSITGIAHRGVFMNPRALYDKDENPYYYMDMDSRTTFVVYSPFNDQEPVLGVSYIQSFDANGSKYFLVTAYTRDEIYEYKTTSLNNLESKNLLQGYPKVNPVGMIPIIECENNQFRIGHCEPALTVMNAINKLSSDSVNDVEQFVNSILVSVNAEFTKETMDNVKNHKFAQISSSQGLPADLKYISNQLDGGSVESLRQYLEDSVRAIVGIPDRKSRGGGGGDTGEAVKLRDGWADMEIVARTTWSFFEESERKELKVMLKILKDLKLVKDTNMVNVKIQCPRNKTDNLINKANAMATLVNTKIVHPIDIIEVSNAFGDPQAVYERGQVYQQELVDKALEFQENNMGKVEGNDTTSQDDGVDVDTQEGE